MILLAAIVGFSAVGGVLLVKAHRSRLDDAPPRPPPKGDQPNDGEQESAAKSPKSPQQDSTLKDVKQTLGYAKDVASLAGGGDDAVKAASKLTQELVKGTIGDQARTQEGKLAANLGGVAAAGVSAWAAYEVFLASTTIAGPVGLAIGTAAVVAVAIIVNLVDIAVTLDKQRQRPFLQAEIDKRVSEGNLLDAWALTMESQARGIPVGFKVSQPMWGDARRCVRWPPPGQDEGKGPQFLDAEEVIVAAFAKARAAYDADLKLPVKRNAAGVLVRSRKNRDRPEALESKRIGEAWCRYIGGHYESGICDDGVTRSNAWVGLTPWQDQEMLVRYYGPPLDTTATGANRVPGTAKGARDAKTNKARTGAAGTGSPGTTTVTVGSTSSGTGGGKTRETDL